jgi:aminopeptidase N
MNRFFSLTLLIVSGFSVACKVNKNPKSQQITQATPQQKKQEVILQLPYKSSETQRVDMQHLWLDIRFDYENEQAMGKASLFVKPHFYPVNEVSLDAKYFKLHRVARISGKDTINLAYTYDSLKLKIELGKSYAHKETIQLYIDYTAQPGKIKGQGGRAISDEKGLYFINAQRKIKDKPRQIWTQGEPQSNSGWVPLVDVPNQKLTQELFITVDETDVTLSNGELMYSSFPAKGKRTDYWKQTKPHAPYLIMMAIGEFSITKDYWRDSVEVNYYLEKQYAPYAKLIFGKTPKMIECFSQRLGVDYPWDKYSQVVVRDFVSGAMENTGAVIHYDQVQHTPREHLDNTHEDIIAHELFHHWFGDLVTCESWSNITLNESFATYGEYIWNECEYDRNTADFFFANNLNAYLRQRKKHDVNLMRERYHKIDDVFDVVSYQKGSRVVHMLRNYVGDEAFFATLKLYLTRHAFGTAEVHHLRQAFEEVTGEDLNWFFNQWYFNAGHPDLVVKHTIAPDGMSASLHVKQMQDSAAYGIFKLPIDVIIVTDKQKHHTRITMEEREQYFQFNLGEKISVIHFDANGVLLANVEEHKTHEQWYAQLTTGSSVLSLAHALNGMSKTTAEAKENKMADAVKYAVNQSFFGNRMMGLMYCDELTEEELNELSHRIAQLAQHDSVAAIRSMAMEILADTKHTQREKIIEAGLNDSAYSVVRSAFRALIKTDRKRALRDAAQLVQLNRNEITAEVLLLYSSTVSPEYFEFFTNGINSDNKLQSLYLRRFGEYLGIQSTDVQLRGAQWLKQFAEERASGNVLNTLRNAQNGLKLALQKKQKDLNDKLVKTKDAAQKAEAEVELKKVEQALGLL